MAGARFTVSEYVSDSPSTVAPAPSSCLGCGKTGGKLLCCGRCRNAWFCNRECQPVARKELGHKGANCRPAVQTSASEAVTAPSQMEEALLVMRFRAMLTDADVMYRANSRLSHLAAVEKSKEAAVVADLIGGACGASFRVEADQLIAESQLALGNMAAASGAACSTLRAARASGSITELVNALVLCANVADEAPAEMAAAETEIRLPTTAAALSRLGLAYHEAAVATCDAALAAFGGRGSPAAADPRLVPSLQAEAQARGSLGACLHELREDRQRSLELTRGVAAAMRQILRAAPTADSKRTLAAQLSNLGAMLIGDGADGMAEAEACLREALKLVDATDDVKLQQTVLTNLVNMAGVRHNQLKPAEAEALRSRLNALYAQTGRSSDTTCTICLEPLEHLEQPGGGADKVATGHFDDRFTELSVHVLECGHQFHPHCLLSWQRGIELRLPRLQEGEVMTSVLRRGV